MTKVLNEIFLLEPGGEIRLGDGAPGVNFTGLRIYKSTVGYRFETYDNDELRIYIDEHGILRRAIDGEVTQTGEGEILPSSDLLEGDNDWTGINTFLKALVLADGATFGSKGFSSGLDTGNGLRIWRDTNNNWRLELDRIDVRSTMIVSELLFMQKRVFNGSIIIARSGTGKPSRMEEVPLA